jgi:hypothetical protein
LILLDFYRVRIVQGGCRASIGRCRAQRRVVAFTLVDPAYRKGAKHGSEEKGEEEVEEEGLTFSSFVRASSRART